MPKPPSFPFPLETDHQTTIPLSVSDLQLDRAKRDIRLGPWIARFVALALVATAGWAIWHLYGMQRSTAAALAGARSDHADTRSTLRDARAELTAAQLRVEELQTTLASERERFERDTAEMREQLGPELAGVSELGEALNGLDHVRVLETTPRSLRVRLAPYRMFTGNQTELSERGAEYLMAVAEAIRESDTTIEVRVSHRSRETAAARALAVSAYLGGAGEVASRRLRSVVMPPARQPVIQLALSPN